MIGIFYKDVWGLIYEELERKYDVKTLNSLSCACKQLYNMDIHRRKFFISQCGPLPHRVGNYFKLSVPKRPDYYSLIKFNPIITYLRNYIDTEGSTNVYKLCDALNILNATTLDELNKIPFATVLDMLNVDARYLELVKNQLAPSDASDAVYIFSLFLYDNDIVESIMSLQF